MKRLLFCLLGLFLMVTTAGATTINFDALTVPDAFAANLTEAFRTNPINSSVGWTQAQGIGGNATPAVFAHMEGLGKQSVNLLTFIPFALHGDQEFTFRGVDIYRDSTAFMQVNIQGQHDATQAFGPWAFSVGIQPGTGWFHYNLDDLNLRINTNEPPEFAHTTVIGALSFTVSHVTGTPGVTVGFDNLRVCQSIAQPCSYDAPISFTTTAPPVAPIVPQTNVPEPSTWIYLFLAVGMVMGFRKYAHV